ncbi:Uncharacterised protein g9509 [Pycnogonum litorale]
MTTEEYKSVCEQLDKLAHRVLNIVDDILEGRGELESTLKSAYIDMAQARYSMGSKSVSMLQISEADSRPLWTVRNEIITGDSGEEYKKYTLVDNGVSERALKYEKDDGADDGLRRRKTDSSDSVESMVKRISLSENGKRKNDKNPINWFGVLVPKCLRQSQISFQTAIKLSIHLVSLQSELTSCCENYREIVEQKKKHRQSSEREKLKATR